jgi:hypothetical protein
MKFKTYGRIGGLFDTCLFSYFVYKSTEALLDPKTNMMIATAETLFMPFLLLGVADGLADVTKGTHHYLVNRAWYKLTKNPEIKKSLDEILKLQNQMREESLQLFLVELKKEQTLKY